MWPNLNSAPLTNLSLITAGLFSRSFVHVYDINLRKGTIEFIEKTSPNVHIIDVSKFLSMITDSLLTI